MKNLFPVVSLMLCILVAIPSHHACADDTTLYIGRIHNNPKKHYARVKHLGDYIVKNLTNGKFTQAEAIFTTTVEEMANLMNLGKVHMLSETTYSASYLMHKGNAQLLLREWRDGVDSYKSVLFAHQDAPIQNINDLAGKVIAFEDPGSTSSYILPSMEIKRAGFTLVELKYPEEKTDLRPDQVGYVFARSEVNIPLWVQDGLVDAGALSNLDMEDDDVVPPKTVLPNLRVFHESPAYPRAMLLVAKDLDPETTMEIRRVLLQANLDPEGAQTLDRYKHVTQYDAVPEQEAQAVLDLFDQVKQ